MNDFDSIIKRITVTHIAPGDYTGEDGLLYCGKCRTPKQFRMDAPPLEGRLLPHPCRCEQERLDREGIELKPGAAELLAWLKRHDIRSAIATATDLRRTEKYLRGLGIRDYFDQVISATMVQEGKPSPDIYLYACRQLGRHPRDCMAVEDSPNGVLSAARAGCRVVMVPDQTDAEPELERLLYAKVKRLDEITGLL